MIFNLIFDNYQQLLDNPPPIVTTAQKYQIWSSVLGASLTTITPDGNKSETKVFAGSAIIAKQKRVAGNNQNLDLIPDWFKTNLFQT